MLAKHVVVVNALMVYIRFRIFKSARLLELETPDHLAGGLVVYNNRGEGVARWMGVVRCNNNKEDKRRDDVKV